MNNYFVTISLQNFDFHTFSDNFLTLLCAEKEFNINYEQPDDKIIKKNNGQL